MSRRQWFTILILLSAITCCTSLGGCAAFVSWLLS